MSSESIASYISVICELCGLCPANIDTISYCLVNGSSSSTSMLTRPILLLQVVLKSFLKLCGRKKALFCVSNLFPTSGLITCLNIVVTLFELYFLVVCVLLKSGESLLVLYPLLIRFLR
jgi:hypothetical protein